MISKNASKIDEIFIVDLTLCSKCQMDGEDFVNFFGLLRKHELYHENCLGNNNSRFEIERIYLNKIES